MIGLDSGTVDSVQARDKQRVEWCHTISSKQQVIKYYTVSLSQYFTVSVRVYILNIIFLENKKKKKPF